RHYVDEPHDRSLINELRIRSDSRHQHLVSRKLYSAPGVLRAHHIQVCEYQSSDQGARWRWIAVFISRRSPFHRRLEKYLYREGISDRRRLRECRRDDDVATGAGVFGDLTRKPGEHSAGERQGGAGVRAVFIGQSGVAIEIACGWVAGH